MNKGGRSGKKGSRPEKGGQFSGLGEAINGNDVFPAPDLATSHADAYENNGV